ncbi:MAG: sigma-70 family RNA polymerase sigma factor [Pseudomonadota bacterium]
MDAMTIEDLLARIALGDRRAFSEVYDRTSAKLFSVALRILSDQAEAEDALQEAYVKVWRNAASFEIGRASPMTWLITIARNTAIDRARKRKETPIDATDLEEQVDIDPSPEDMAVLADDHARLRQCLDELDDEQRAVVKTAFFTGRTYAEIADWRKKPLGTVKSWVRRSLMKLRACLERTSSEPV